MKKYTRTFHEVHTSEDGEKWYRNGLPSNDSPEGLKKAQDYSKAVGMRYVRVVHVTKHIKVLSQSENKAVLSKQEIASLLTLGNEAIKGIKGLTCSEGFLMSFNPLGHGPERVTISFNAVALLGKCPGGPSYAEAKRAWNEQAIQSGRVALADAEARLKAAGVNYSRTAHEIILKP